MASGTALIYDDEMTSYKLLWDNPECDIEVPERLLSSYEQLKHYHLLERCVHVPVREGTEEEIMLVHSSEYLEVVKSTQTMNEEELRRVSGNYDAVYFHPNTYRCAKLAVGATLQLVDSVMSGKVCNGMALVRPPGHHSQRNAANGFCVFNNVAIAAQYAKRRYGLQRILIVDWDVHHGQGIQYVFEEDPSVLYYSWHRYEHQQFWPLLRESDYDAVGQGKGKGFNFNVPWNKFVPELILVSSGYDSGIGDPEVCNGIAESSLASVSTTFALKHCFDFGLQSAFDAELVKEERTLLSLQNVVAVLDKILKKKVCNGIAESSLASVSTTFALKHCFDFGLQRKILLMNICQKQQTEKTNSKYHISLNWKEDAERNNFFCAVLGFILPVAYSYQPDLMLIVIGPNRSLGVNGISLLTCLLQGLAESRILVVIQDTEINLVQSVAKALSGVPAPDFGAYAPASQENVLEIKRLRNQLQQEWKMLRCSGLEMESKTKHTVIFAMN
ncbi:Histone deacetylase 10 [Chelonia mydas]|uniref:Histone deacetylase 10 n=1 Tax=Chelonia mydas TaxID=8469 RepID=M7BMR9_CHEMY|nr:Histone deacetylase 10 [Chelonia mydas]